MRPSRPSSVDAQAFNILTLIGIAMCESGAHSESKGVHFLILALRILLALILAVLAIRASQGGLLFNAARESGPSEADHSVARSASVAHPVVDSRCA